MKKRFTSFLAALALLVFMTPSMVGWGQSTVTFDATTDITANAQSYQTNVLTINAADGSTWKATGYGATVNTNIVIGKGGANYLETPSVNGTISEVAVTWSGNTSYYLALQTTDGTELSNYQNPSTSTTKIFTVSGSYSQLRLVGRRNSGVSNAAATITKVVVTYTTSGGGGSSVTAPELTPSCTFTTTQEVTITPADGTTAYYTTDGTTPDNTKTQYTESFSVSATTTVKAIAYDGDNNTSNIVEETYTKLTNIEDITAAGTYAVKGTVVAKSMKGMVVGDGSGYVYYNNGNAAPNYTEGDEITIVGPVTVSGSSDPKLYQFEASTSTITPASSSTYNPETATPFTLTELTTSQTTGTHLSEYYTFVGVLNKPGTGTQYVIDIGEESQIQINSPGSSATITTTTLNPLLNKKVTVTGYFTGVANYYSVMAATIEENTEADTYEWVPVALGDLQSSDVFVIVGNNGSDYAMSNDQGTSSRPKAISVTVTDGNISSPVPHSIKWHIGGDANNGYIFYQNLSTTDWVYCNTSNNIRVGNTNSNNLFEFKNNYLYNKGRSGYLGVYNSQDWRWYSNYTGTSNIAGQTFTFYKRQLVTSDPTLTVSANNINDFSYIVGNGPSAVKSFSVGGRNLGTGQVTIALGENSNFEMALAEDATTWSNTVSLTPTDGTVSNATVYVRMKASLDEGDYSNEVSVTWGTGEGSLSETVSLSGTVNPAPVITTYNMVTSVTPGKHYIIVSTNANDDYYAMGGQSGTYRSAIPIFVDSNSTTIASNSGVSEVVISGNLGSYTLHVSDGYLVMTGDKEINNNGTIVSTWSITFSDNEATIKPSTGDYTSYALQFNGNNPRFTGYTSTQRSIMLFEKASDTELEYYSNTSIANPTLSATNTMTVESGVVLTFTGTPSCSDASWLVVKDGGQLKFYDNGAKDGLQATVEKNITGYGNDDHVKTGWNFIASPITNEYLLSETAMVSSNERVFDLYRLNNTTWENYKNNEHADFTALDNGTGYLYASSNDITLSFAGTIKPFTTTGNANKVALAAGWNLVGNPYTFNVYSSKSYYAITTENGENVVTAVISANADIAPCTGIVIKNTGTETDYVAFLETAGEWSTGNQGNIQMTLAQQASNRGNATTIDNAIVSFNEGSQLEKFYFGNPSASIFIPQNGEDYAIAFSDRQGDVPLYFKANETGTYTISFAGDEISLNGIYLIDILAEEEIDLSVNPSYTFIGSPADRMARFKIVFRNANGDGTSDIFAYQNGNDIIVSGEGELQIFDVMGRMVSRQYVSGVGTINAMPYGVYIFKLNGMTQKIVVR